MWERGDVGGKDWEERRGGNGSQDVKGERKRGAEAVTGGRSIGAVREQ